MADTAVVVERPRTRLVELDRVRGLAIGLMLVDHLSFLLGVTELRMTLGRLAMPLFFLLAGTLFTHLTRRHWYCLGLGVVLSAFVPWAGYPNILVQFFAVAVVLELCHWLRVPNLLVVVVGLTVAANHVAVGGPMAYEYSALISLAALGHIAGPRWALELGAWLPDALAVVGRRPLRWYVGHVLLIQGVILWLSRA